MERRVQKVHETMVELVGLHHGIFVHVHVYVARRCIFFDSRRSSWTAIETKKRMGRRRTDAHFGKFVRRRQRIQFRQDNIFIPNESLFGSVANFFGMHVDRYREIFRYIFSYSYIVRNRTGTIVLVLH